MDNQLNNSADVNRPSEVPVDLSVNPERRLIRPTGSARHVDVTIKVGHPPRGSSPARQPVRTALVLDRSGSMARGKLETAKRAALAVIDHLDERDRVAVVVFDDHVDVVQPLTAVTSEVKQQLRSVLGAIEARANTALHQGCLTGALAVASDDAADATQQLAHVFLLIDGIANVGEQDPERIAARAADVRENAGVSTSTFGIGADYNEGLVGPMAVAGDGQFHHLRSAQDIAATFVGELSDLLAAAVRGVTLELRLDPLIHVDVVSAFHVRTVSEGDHQTLRVAIGNLLPDDERYVVSRFGSPRSAVHSTSTIQMRLCWRSEGIERATAWHDTQFTCADHNACDAGEMDAAVMHWVGLPHAERARQQATERSRDGDPLGAQEIVRKVRGHIANYAGDDPDLRRAIAELDDLDRELQYGPFSSLRRKELTSRAYRTSRGQKDFRDLL